MEALAHFCRDFSIGHLVSGFDADDSRTQALAYKALFEFALGLARTEEEDGCRIANMRDDVIVVPVEMDRELPVPLIIRRALFRRGSTGKAHVLLHA